MRANLFLESEREEEKEKKTQRAKMAHILSSLLIPLPNVTLHVHFQLHASTFSCMHFTFSGMALAFSCMQSYDSVKNDPIIHNIQLVRSPHVHPAQTSMQSCASTYVRNVHATITCAYIRKRSRSRAHACTPKISTRSYTHARTPETSTYVRP